MYCPQCGQERFSQETSFCSRCGFLLTGVADLLTTGGLIPQNRPSIAGKSMSPRSRGIKQGLFIFLLTFLIVPIIAIVSSALRLPPFGVPIAAIVLFVGGLLRMVYAAMFESAVAEGYAIEGAAIAGPQALLNQNRVGAALPGQTSIPATDYITPRTGQWRDTNDLQPASVTEGTTKLLEKDELPQ